MKKEKALAEKHARLQKEELEKARKLHDDKLKEAESAYKDEMRQAKKMHEVHLHDTRKKMQASSSVISILNKQKERKKHSMLKMAHSWKSKAGKKSVERKAEDEINQLRRDAPTKINKIAEKE